VGTMIFQTGGIESLSGKPSKRLIAAGEGKTPGQLIYCK